jgi:hypothetical protein
MNGPADDDHAMDGSRASSPDPGRRWPTAPTPPLGRDRFRNARRAARPLEHLRDSRGRPPRFELAHRTSGGAATGGAATSDRATGDLGAEPAGDVAAAASGGGEHEAAFAAEAGADDARIRTLRRDEAITAA